MIFFLPSFHLVKRYIKKKFLKNTCVTYWSTYRCRKKEWKLGGLKYEERQAALRFFSRLHPLCRTNWASPRRTGRKKIKFNSYVLVSTVPERNTKNKHKDLIHNKYKKWFISVMNLYGLVVRLDKKYRYFIWISPVKLVLLWEKIILPVY